jgi:hypothetical protein
MTIRSFDCPGAAFGSCVDVLTDIGKTDSIGKWNFVTFDISSL